MEMLEVKTLMAWCFAGVLVAQSVPAVRNGQLETRALAGDLAAQLKSDKPTWFGYTIKTPAKRTNGAMVITESDPAGRFGDCGRVSESGKQSGSEAETVFARLRAGLGWTAALFG